ncbi:unnamed protein product [Effrenium voratum]|nr:unnamed protein product [Effrenium voratum]
MGATQGASADRAGQDQVVFQKAVASTARTLGRYGGVLLQASTALDGSLLFAGAAGTLSTGARSNISVGDTFEVASVTKMVTATVILQLEDEGLLRLEDPWTSVKDGAVKAKVQEHVPTWPFQRFGDVTILQLLQHTSCLPNFWDDDSEFIKAFEADPNRLWSTWELLSYAADMAMPFPAAKRGTAEAFHYADTNYLLLGLVVEALTSSPLPAAFRERVFTPAGMSRQGTYCEFLEDRPQDAPPLAARYFGKLQITGNKQHSADSFAAGGIVSTAQDLEKFMGALASGKLFPLGGQRTLHKMMSWIPAKRGKGFWYGLGLMRVDLEDQAGFFERFSRSKPRGYIWGHEGFGGAFAWYWVPGPEEDGLILTGTTNNEVRNYGDLIVKVVKQVQKKNAALRALKPKP